MSKKIKEPENIDVNTGEIIPSNERLKYIPTSELPEGYKRMRVQFDITYKGSEAPPKDGKSLTEPDLSIGLSQLLENHTRGREIPQQQPLFFGVQVPTFNDLTDIEEYQNHIRGEMQNVEQWLKEEKEKAAAEAKAEEEEKDSSESTETPQKSTESKNP